MPEEEKPDMMNQDEENQAPPVPEEKKAPMPPEESGKKLPPPGGASKPGAASQPGAPASKKKGVKKAPPREKNPKFKDMEENGAWGSMSSTEMYVGIAIMAALVIGGAVAIALVVTGGEDSEPVIVPAPPRPTDAPTAAPTDVSPNKMLENVLAEISSIPGSNADLSTGLPVTASAYEGLRDSETASAREKAMSWLLYDDEWEFSADALTRWVLASIYYQTGGEDWIKQENWLSNESVCEWENVECEPISQAVREIDLQKNGLVGSIPVELALLTNLQALWLRENELTGTIPGPELGSLPRLTILYLESNQLTGSVPPELRNNQVLNTLYVQFNQLTGFWPVQFCPDNAFKPLENFGLDCDRVSCPATCCNGFSCYRDIVEVTEPPELDLGDLDLGLGLGP